MGSPAAAGGRAPLEPLVPHRCFPALVGKATRTPRLVQWTSVPLPASPASGVGPVSDSGRNERVVGAPISRDEDDGPGARCQEVTGARPAAPAGPRGLTRPGGNNGGLLDAAASP